MKKCPYCGKEYPDDAVVCAVDGQSLADQAEARAKITGVWRGAYGFETPEALAGSKVVPFTLKLKQGWMEHFTGTVNEDPPNGMPGNGTIDGYFDYPTIEFNKQMPICYVATLDGRMITLREKLLADGHACEFDPPHPPIFYEGKFLDANRVQGTWIIRPTSIPVPGGGRISMPQATGIWCAEFITTDMRAVPSGGPQEAFYDKTLLPQPDLSADTEEKGASAFRNMGKFPVMEAETFLKRFEEEKVRFEINRDDSAIRQMMPFTAIMGGLSGTAPMIEIFVHPDDEAKAIELMGEDDKV
jgi:hypothetical protein